MGLSKTAAAAKRAVERGNKKDAKPREWPDVLKDIRNNLDAKLAVTPGDVRQLLERYDALIAGCNAAPFVEDSIDPRMVTGEIHQE